MTLQILLVALAGALLGLAADRIASRWPSHRRQADEVPGEPELPGRWAPGTERTPRSLDWRTPTMMVVGALAFGALAARWTEPRDLLILGGWFAALTVLMATDLDQRILPDAITLPMIPIALVLVLAGIDPLLEGKDLALLSSLVAALGAPIVLAGMSLVLSGGIGIGDLKLAVSLGLMSGISRLFVGFLAASAASSILLVALLVSRRLSLKSPIPFGLVLIAAGFVAALLPA